MNLWVSMEDEGAATSDAEAFESARAHLAPHLEAVGASKPRFSQYEPLRFEDQVRVLLDAKVPAFSFIYGIPPKEILEECQLQGILTIGTARAIGAPSATCISSGGSTSARICTAPD